MPQKNSRNNGNSQPHGQVRKIKINQTIELNSRQQRFLDIGMSKDTSLMFGIGPAGTSKTYLSVLCALELLNRKAVESLLYIRSAVESTENRLGFLPGEEAMKLEPYLRPLRDKLTEFLTKTEISWVWQQNLIDVEHVGFSRGQDWKNKVIIIDEAQNLTFEELLTLVTRCGEGSKVFIIGDPMQSDIGNRSGFVNFYKMFDNEESKQHKIQCFKFTEEDIVRSKLVKYIIGVCRKYNESQKQ
jgi:phosphate starvation-inducible PhoH-like protein